MRHRTRTRNAGRRLLGTGAGYLFFDSFTGADGTALTAHTPEIGPAWVVQTAGSVFQLQGNAAALTTTAAGNMDVIAADVGRADVLLTFAFTNASDAGVVVRAADGANYWLVQVGLGVAKLYEVLAGVATAPEAAALPSGSSTSALTVLVRGATVAVYEGGTLLFAHTMTSLLTATKVGLFSNFDQSVRIDNFAVRAA